MLKAMWRRLSATRKYRIRMTAKRIACQLVSLRPRKKLESTPEVTIFITNRNLRYPLELTIESLRRYTRYPAYKIVVADNASTDGSLEYLQNLQKHFPLEIIKNTEAKSHVQCLDWAMNNITTPYWVGMDNDLYVLGGDWLTDLILEMERDKETYLLGGELIERALNQFEPVGRTYVDIAERFSAWLFCVRTTLRDHVQSSFSVDDAINKDTGRPLIYDTGGRLMRDMKANGVKVSFMPKWYRYTWHHFGSLSWSFDYEASEDYRQLKTYQLAEIQRRLQSGRI